MNVHVRRTLQPLRIRYAEPLRRHAGNFWSWWNGELFALLPENAKSAIAQRRQKLFLEADGDQLLLSLGNHTAQREFLRLPLQAGEASNEEMPREVQQTILLMPADKVLSKRLSLPLAAEENLREVLGFEMDQHTPFMASDVCYDYTIIGRNSRKQELTLDLVYAPRREVDKLLGDLSTHGLQADVVTCRRRDNSNLQPVNLLPVEQRRIRRFNVRSLNLALTALLAILLIAAITIPIVQKNRAIAQLELRVQAASVEAREGSQLRQDLEKMAEASRFLLQKKGSDVMTVQLIDELSRLLPDHTWIVRLDLSDSELQVQGQSSASSTLIAIIESSPYFENVRFRSPVVQIQGTNNDRFHLSADVTGGTPQ